MNAKSRRATDASHRYTLSERSVRPRPAGARFALTVVLGAMGAFLWMLPSAQAEGAHAASSAVGMVTGTVPMQDAAAPAPFTVAANGPIHLTIGAGDGAPAAAPAAPVRGPSCSGPVGEHTTVVVPLGKSTMVNLREPIRERTVGNPSVIQSMLVSPQTLYLLGSDIGTTNMIVQGKSGSCSVIDVVVGADPAGLQQTLASLMPEETGVQVKTAGDSIVLTGTVTDAGKAQRIVELAQAYTQRASAAVPVASGHGTAAAGAAAPSAGGDKSERIINMMQIAAPQQVMLEVKVAEVDKTLIDQLGAQANLNGNIGSWSFGLLAQFLSGGLGAVGASKANNSPLALAVDAQKTDQLVKILAEPNLMAISGQEASFLAGGKVFIPVPQSNGAGSTTITLQEEVFGVGLTFTPTVLEGGRINLKVSPEVSELSPTGVAVTANGTSGTAILPLITTRRASTTLQVFDGQSFAIGGLLKSNVTGTLKALPGVGELPVLGALFRDTNYESDKTELVFVVTPRLAKPLPKNYPLPTDSFAEVNEGMVYATGNMEGTKRAMPSAPASAGAAVATPPAVVVVPPSAALPGATPAVPHDAAPSSTQAPTPATDPGASPLTSGSKPIALDESSVQPVQTAQINVTPLSTPPALAQAGPPDRAPPNGHTPAHEQLAQADSPPVPALAANPTDPPGLATTKTSLPAAPQTSAMR
jgi:pilus assembly protein CpaC